MSRIETLESQVRELQEKVKVLIENSKRDKYWINQLIKNSTSTFNLVMGLPSSGIPNKKKKRTS